MNRSPGTNCGAWRAEQFSHLGNYTLTFGYFTVIIAEREEPKKKTKTRH